MKWEQRPCNDCQLQLGCPHSKLAGSFAVDATKFVREVVLKQFCKQNRISKEDNRGLSEDDKNE